MLDNEGFANQYNFVQPGLKNEISHWEREKVEGNERKIRIDI